MLVIKLVLVWNMLLPSLHRATEAVVGGAAARNLRRVLRCVDTHCGGQPARVVVGGAPEVPGATMLDKVRHLQQHDDELRRMLMFEPRGSPAMMADLIVPPCDISAAAGLVIMEQTEYPAMSGHNTICTVTALLEAGIVPMVEPQTEFTIDTPAGLVGVTAACEAGHVTCVTLRNVPSFAMHLGAKLHVPQLGELTVDVAWGGMFYVIADAAQLGLSLTPGEGAAIVRAGRMITQAAREQLPVSHPAEASISGVSICCLAGPLDAGHRPPGGAAEQAALRAKNAVVIATGALDWDDPDTFASGIIDRSPCGTGTCARMAVLHARGDLPLQTDFIHESITGETFTGRLHATCNVGGIEAVEPSISGRAWVTGYNTLFVHEQVGLDHDL